MEPFAGRAPVGVAVVIIVEVSPREGLIAALGFVEDGDMRLDPLLVDQPVQHLGPAVSRVANQALGIEAAPIPHPLDHVASGPALCLADRCGGLDVDDDRVLKIDEM